MCGYMWVGERNNFSLLTLCFDIFRKKKKLKSDTFTQWNTTWPLKKKKGSLTLCNGIDGPGQHYAK